MPIYEYGCPACGHQFEEIQKVSDAPLTDCPPTVSARSRGNIATRSSAHPKFCQALPSAMKQIKPCPRNSSKAGGRHCYSRWTPRPGISAGCRKRRRYISWIKPR